jgi:hypothetical protein
MISIELEDNDLNYHNRSENNDLRCQSEIPIMVNIDENTRCHLKSKKKSVYDTME